MTGGGFDTAVVQADELFPRSGSTVLAAAIPAVFWIVVASAVTHGTFTTRVKVAVSPGAMVDFEHENVPVPPEAGVEHDQPPGAELET